MRKPWFVVGLALLVGGCSTPGPLHLYAVTPGGPEIHDTCISGQDRSADVPSFLQPGDELTGFAYDPFTDHFFLRLAPGDHIRVVDRPARKIKREFVIAGVAESGGGDLAINPRTGHLYLLDAGRRRLAEVTRLGKFLRFVALADRGEPVAAVAFDPATDRLLVLEADHRTIHRYDLAGRSSGGFELDQPVIPSIAWSAESRQLAAPLADGSARVGMFDETGKLIRTIPLAAGDRFIDLGPHSFLRVF